MGCKGPKIDDEGDLVQLMGGRKTGQTLTVLGESPIKVETTYQSQDHTCNHQDEGCNSDAAQKRPLDECPR